MRTILHLIETSGPGGAEKMLVSLVEHLDRSRYRSLVCLLEGGWLESQLRSRGLETLIVEQRGTLDVRWLSTMARLVKSRAVDLLHAHEFAMNTYGTMVAAVTGTPIVTTVHGTNYYADKWRRRAAYRFVAGHSAMVAVSDDLRRFLCRSVGIPHDRIATIPNGIDASRYRSTGGRESVRRQLASGRQVPIIGTVGNLYSVKGHSCLLQAAALVLRVVPDAVFPIVGRGELLAGLRGLARELGVEQHVRFLGFRNDVPSLLSAMDVFVLPSLHEGLPLALLEAMAARKPVVATDVGGVPEVIQNGRTGLLVPPRDPEALAGQILRLLADRPLAERLGSAAGHVVEHRFSLDAMVRRYEALYARCWQSRQPVAA